MTDQEQQQLTAAGNEMSASFLAAKKRSDATLAKLEAEPGKFTMLTGDQPDRPPGTSATTSAPSRSAWPCRTAA